MNSKKGSTGKKKLRKCVIKWLKRILRSAIAKLLFGVVAPLLRLLLKPPYSFFVGLFQWAYNALNLLLERMEEEDEDAEEDEEEAEQDLPEEEAEIPQDSEGESVVQSCASFATVLIGNQSNRKDGKNVENSGPSVEQPDAALCKDKREVNAEDKTPSDESYEHPLLNEEAEACTSNDDPQVVQAYTPLVSDDEEMDGQEDAHIGAQLQDLMGYGNEETTEDAETSCDELPEEKAAIRG